MTVSEDLWVFGYGSLMWRPDLPFVEQSPAVIRRLHRAFCVTSTHHRGTERRPGLVLGLDHGGTCVGVAYRIAPEKHIDVLAYLRERELIYGVYREARVTATLVGAARRTVSALAYIVERSHPSYAGHLPLAEQARLIRAAAGSSGTNLDYLINTVAHLRALGIRERSLERLEALAAGFIRGSGSGQLGRHSAEALARSIRQRVPERAPLSRDQRRRFCYRWRVGRT